MLYFDIRKGKEDIITESFDKHIGGTAASNRIKIQDKKGYGKV